MTAEGRGRRLRFRGGSRGVAVFASLTLLGSAALADGPRPGPNAAKFPFGGPNLRLGGAAGAGQDGDEGSQGAGGLRLEPQGSEPPHFEPVWSRWFAPGRPVGGLEPPSYGEVNEAANPLNPYRQNVLKGDFPIFGTEDLFLLTTVTDRLIVNQRKAPTPAGITVVQGSTDGSFFGRSDQQFISNDLVLDLDLFKGQQAFKPVEWRLKVAGVFNYNYLDVKNLQVAKIDVTKGRKRTEYDYSLQLALFEYHILDLTDRYDFLSAEVGILPFRSDFRGFIFDDVNLGARLLGNYDQNKWQYNLVYFDMLDKDTNSGLNNFDDRHQNVLIANLYRQDWPVLGYITSVSFHYNKDDRGFHFDDNGVLVTPAPIGFARPNEVESFYLGWAGEGHFGRVNITHAFYQALGEEDQNPFAARDVDINAQFAAMELSYDIDWWRVRLFGEYASGDNDARDGDANGFDAIIDAPNFAGGEVSFFNSQAIRLLGVNLTNALSPLPDLQSSRNEGQSNFVNPGLILAGGAVDFEITPKWRAQVGGSYLRFVNSGVLETYLELPNIDNEIGAEVFCGSQYRPFLNNHVNILTGASLFFPGAGFEKIYQDEETLFQVFLNLQLTW